MRFTHYPRHPGRVLVEEFMEPINCSREELAHELGWTQAFLDQFIRGDAAVTPELANDLSRVLGTNRYVWLQLQARHSSARAHKQGSKLAA